MWLQDENKTVARRIVEEIVNRGDMATFDELVHPDYRDHIEPPGDFGRDGYRELILQTRTALPDLRMTIEDEIAEGDRVVIRTTVRGTHRGDFLGVAPTGLPVTLRAIGILRIVDGRLVERWNASDLLGVLEQLGATPGLASTSDTA